MKTIYTVPVPDSLGAVVEVYGEPENAWYEWRIIDGGRTVRDTGTEGHSAFQGRQYGQAEIVPYVKAASSGLPSVCDAPVDNRAPAPAESAPRCPQASTLDNTDVMTCT